MLQNPFLRFLLLLLLLFSFLLSLTAVPTTRSLRSDDEYLTVQESLGAGDLGLVDVGEGEGFIEGRMDMESTDYPGTGANNHHDPRTPGRA
ncbi:uncharacterized protein Pyn_13058 [Prunus yedoensis var. nudiflora]|uniref:Uncharacterized protein n=1 Tax=Prunus yedoensis var. nudiflora TaxID=2094558 RepID=A0A314Y9E1_PRUYE|nr:uncharacterized protein Pyn_13058 [Prunus yedoensis var. nudiflora]